MMLKCGLSRKLELLIGLFLLVLLVASIVEARKGERQSAFRKRASKPHRSSLPVTLHRKATVHTVHQHVIRPKKQRVPRKKAALAAHPSHIVRSTSRLLKHGRTENGTVPNSPAKAGRIRGLDDLALRFREWDDDARYLQEPRGAVVVAKRSRTLAIGRSKAGGGNTSDRLERTVDRRPTGAPTSVDNGSNVQYSMLLAREQYARDQSLRSTTIKPNTTSFSPYEINPSPSPDY